MVKSVTLPKRGRGRPKKVVEPPISPQETVPEDLTTTESDLSSKLEVPIAVADLPSAFPIPFDYREIVNNVLNRHFGIQMGYTSGGGAFEFTIIVPDKYSSITSEAKAAIGGHDRRTKMILSAEGGFGVGEWSRLVYSSFSPEIQAMIVADRVMGSI